MFFKLVVLAIALQVASCRQFEDKSVYQTILMNSNNGGVDVHSEKYVKVFDPKIQKYAYKKITVDNGKVHHEAGFLDDDQAVESDEDATMQGFGNFDNFFGAIDNFFKNIFSGMSLF